MQEVTGTAHQGSSGTEHLCEYNVGRRQINMKKHIIHFIFQDVFFLLGFFAEVMIARAVFLYIIIPTGL